MYVEELPRNKENQQAMEAYMKYQFSFLGLKAPDRKKYTQPIVRESKTYPTEEALKLIDAYYAKNEREYQYTAIDLAVANVRRFDYHEMLSLAKYVEEKAWWDTVDAWRKFFSLWVDNHPTELPSTFSTFYGHENFWMRRVAITLQLKCKMKTDTILLSKAIEYDQMTEEFFIQKAIGWSLREYSKVNAVWVRDFLHTYKLSKLATREGSKFLEE